ncbi:MAG: hypothetical protein CVV24_09235 [Ignavibacteriae bacterium HGW-Ignavibacteriae-3]|nr:MAG: hypothetical protein CVV24_09235 [Ignavibacteriae bacterium HGW-Ignavibacteriae-3]
MHNRLIKLFFFSALLFTTLYIFSCATKSNEGPEVVVPVSENPKPDTLKPDPNLIPQFVNTDYIELNKICSISKFRSGVGHDYSDDFEHCRSMKHYFVPCDDENWSLVKIFSPVDGTVDRIFEEWAGTQVQIKSDKYPQFIFILFHVNLINPLKVGDKVSEGNQLGTHIGSQTMSDMAVVQITSSGRRMISYFNLMTNSLFEKYQARGISARNELIITAEARNADPIFCNGQAFSSMGTIENWVLLK